MWDESQIKTHQRNQKYYYDHREEIIEREKERYRFNKKNYPWFDSRKYLRKLKRQPDLNKIKYQKELEKDPLYNKHHWIDKVKRHGYEKLNERQRKMYHNNIERERHRYVIKMQKYPERYRHLSKLRTRAYRLRKKIFNMERLKK